METRTAESSPSATGFLDPVAGWEAAARWNRDGKARAHDATAPRRKPKATTKKGSKATKARARG